MSRSELDDYYDAYSVDKGTITVEGDDNRDIKKCI